MMLETNNVIPGIEETPEQETVATTAVKTKRGRPKGSKNRPKPTPAEQTAYSDVEVAASDTVVELIIPKHIFDGISGDQVMNILAISDSAVIRYSNKQPVVLKSVK